MLVGCIVVAYAFSVTFWQQESSVRRTRELPLVESSPGVGSTAGSSVLRRTATTSTSAVDRVVPRRTTRKQAIETEPNAPAGSSSINSRVDPSPTPRTSEDPDGPNVSRVGEKGQAVTVNSQAEERTESPEAQRSLKRSQPEARSIAPQRQPARPASGAAGQKRNERRNSSTPPVRSSMMNRGP